MASKYLDYAGLQRLVENIDRKYAPIAAVLFKGTVDDIAHLPAVNTQKAGWMYNIVTGGGTTSDFVEGPGHIVVDGENVAAVEIITGYTLVVSPVSTNDPKALGWYEEDVVSFVDVTDTLDPLANPKTLGLYVEDSLTPGEYILTTDETVVPGTHYFERTATYKLSQDRIPEAGKSYFTADTVMKWDLLAGVFDLENKYLEFGAEFPKNPVNGRTFLYMGEDTSVFTAVADPEGRPADNGYFEGTFTAVADQTTIVNPKQEGLYEEDSSGALTIYVHSSDITRNPSKTYYSGAFAASTDTTVDPAKIYYTEADQYKKTVIYKYDTTEEDWVAQSSAGSDMIAITNREIDDLFI